MADMADDFSRDGFKERREMARKIISGVLIVLSSLLLVLSVVGIGAVLIYNEPLTREVKTRLEEIDTTLAQIQGDLLTSRVEVDRALRIIEAAEEGLRSLTEQTQDASQLLEEVSKSLDDRLIPGLITTRERIDEIRGTLEGLRAALEQVGTIPFLNITLPGDEFIVSIIESVNSLDAEIANMQGLAERASTFVNDTSYLLGGDFNETKQHLEELLKVLDDYDKEITDRRAQIADILEAAPRWIDNASIILTIFLLWFGFSQFGLLLHGLNLRAGGDPLAVLRRERYEEKAELDETVD